MADEPLVICGDACIRWNNLFWGIVKAREKTQRSGQGLLTRNEDDFTAVFDAVYVIASFWLGASARLGFRDSAQRRWIGLESRWYGAWNGFLDGLEIRGRILLVLQCCVALVVALMRMYEGLRPLESVVVCSLIWTCGTTWVLTPSPRNNEWDAFLRVQMGNMLNRVRKQEATEPKDKIYALYGLGYHVAGTKLLVQAESRGCVYGLYESDYYLAWYLGASCRGERTLGFWLSFLGA